jgi:pimeloyl-ACP methyl ester carboxylesterase
MGEQFCDIGGGITLCYERFGDPGHPPILLVMGLATQMIAWHEDFCRQLAAEDFHVVRFDNRDVGRSTHMDFRPPTPGQLFWRRVSPQQYSLSDLAADAAALMRELEIEPAHVVGASMGGMIAQMIAAEHPQSVRSLVSLMSNTGSRWTGQPSPSIYKYLLRPPPSGREAYVERAAEVFGVIGSKELQDAEHVRELAGSSFDRGYDTAGGARQLGAIVASGDRTRKLRTISAPTLVIHGDRDRMVRPSGGRATAKAIPDAKLVVIDGMGHDLPRPLWPRLVGLISDHARDADGSGPETEEREPVRAAGT